MNWKPIYKPGDEPEYAGLEVLLTVENRFGQISTTTAFQGYGDFKWYTNDRTCMEDPKGGDNHLNHALKPLAWMFKPEPYNPYARDIRYLIEDIERKAEAGAETMTTEEATRMTEELIINDSERVFYDSWKKRRIRDIGELLQKEET